MWNIFCIDSIRKKCLNTKFFQVRIFAHSHWIRRDTECLLVFSPNARKYGPEKTLYLDTFHEVTALLSYVLYATPSIFYYCKFLWTFAISSIFSLSHFYVRRKALFVALASCQAWLCVYYRQTIYSRQKHGISNTYQKHL